MVEILERRTPNEKHFLKDNGNIEVQLFRERIHYLKNGKYEEISNELEDHGNSFENVENDYKIIFNKLNGGVKYVKDNWYLEITPRNIKQLNSSIVENTKNRSVVLLQELFDEIDAEYILSFSGIKENLIVKNKLQVSSLEYDIDTNLELAILNGMLVASNYDEKIFTFNVPYMKDSLNVESNEVFYFLDGNKLILTFDCSWINKEERKYPILIDPSFESNDKGIDDTYIYPGDTNDTRYNRDYVIAGVEKINNQDRVNRTLLKFALPTIGTSDEIIKAQLHLYGYMAVNEVRKLTDQEAKENKEKIVTVHEVTRDWTLPSATWDNMNDAYNQNVENIAYISRSIFAISLETHELEPFISTSRNSCYITDLVKRWYNGSPNYGIMIKQAEEEYINSMTPMFFSSNFGEGNLSPVLTIEYRNQNGLESYLDYMTQSFTNGASYVNTFNGNLVASFHLAHTIGVFPASVGIVYNTNDVILKNHTIYGKGYRLSYDQTVEKVASEINQKLKYTDGDGTIHYFYQFDGKYKDEDGLDLEMSLETTTCILKDKNGNNMTFAKNGDIYYLSKIKDISGKEIHIIRDSSNHIIKIEDFNHNEILIAYENNKITFTSPSEIATLNYENDDLKTIVTKEGTTTFLYDSNGILTKIIDVTGLSIEYEYYSGDTKKIRKVTQYGIDHSEGQSFTLTYGLFDTKIVDNKGKVTNKIFNYYGNLLSQNSMSDGSNLKQAYSLARTYGIEGRNKNKLLSNTVPIRYSKNYFKLSNYTNISENFLIYLGTDIYFDDFEFDGVKAVCIRSKQANGVIDHMYPLSDEQKWTVSMKIKTLGRVRVNFYEWQSRNTLYEKVVENTGEFEKVVFISNGEQFSFEIINEIENVDTYIGDIQFEKGDSLSDYNAIDNSNFEEETVGWTLTADPLDTDVVPDVNDIFEVVEIDKEGNKALKVNMYPYNMSNISKKIDVSGKKGDLYYLGFWFKNKGIETDMDPTVAYSSVLSMVVNSVCVYFEPLEGQLERCIPAFELNVNKDSWQYYFMPFSPTEDYKSIQIDWHQGREAGEFYLTNVSLFKKLKTDRYEYDEYGNIIEVNDTKESDIFEYDRQNELISATNPRGKHFKIEYDHNITDRPIRAISSTGISNKVVYDEYGNPIQTKISKDYSEEIVTGYYKIRQRGTNKYLKIQDNNLTLKYDYCSNTTFKIEKIDNCYQISDVVMPNKYLVESSNRVIINTTGNRLFCLEQNKNASYHIYIEDNGNKKYIKWVSDHFEFVSDYSYIEENYLYEFYFEDASRIFIQSDAKYSADGRFIESMKDPLLNETKYTTNTDGLVTKMINPKGIETNYTYNSKNQITKISQGNKEVNYTYNSQNLLSEIIQGNKKYKLVYDSFLNTDTIQVNDRVLVNNEYDEKNGNLLSSTYGNNDVISYQYDEFDRTKTVTKEDNKYEYLYNSNGDIHKLTENDAETYFIYDEEKRLHEYNNNRYYTTSYIDEEKNLITITHKNGFYINNSYDNDDNIVKQVFRLNDTSHEIVNTFNKEGVILESNLDHTNIKYTYDELLRVTNKKINNGYETKYDYVSIGNRTSNIVKSITNGNDKYSYKYDQLYNITDVYLNNNLINHYEYDNYNQLISDQDYAHNMKTEYIYDHQGNILSKIKKNLETDVIINTDTYEYGDSSWEDLLTKYNNESITYDTVGNPLTIGDKILSWINGRQLMSYKDNNLTITYKYGVNGIRTEKVVNGVKTEYYLKGKNIVYEKTESDVIYYLYNGSEILGLKYNNILYYYIKNLQNDIVGILNSNNELIVKYEYDSFGNVLSIRDSSNQIITDSSNIGIINPFRYRGYYYDKETGLYYLNSRYYNPEWGRFLNADFIFGENKDIFSYNLFVYVSNSPIIYIDKNGYGKTIVIAYCGKSNLTLQAEYSEYFITGNLDVEMYYVIKVDDFVGVWNDLKGREDIDRVYMYLHGIKGGLTFYGEDQVFSSKDIKRLEYIHVNDLIALFSCYGGASTENGPSIAKKLSTKTNATVHANTGKVSYSKNRDGRYYARSAYNPFVSGDWITEKTAQNTTTVIDIANKIVYNSLKVVMLWISEEK